MRKLLLLLPMLLAISITMTAREKINIDIGWKYQKGEFVGAETPVFDDGKWTTVNLPHDASIYGEFLKNGEGRSSRSGYRPLGQGWYRRHISYDDSWTSKRIVIEFEGVYCDAKVYVNGQLCEGNHPNGYLDFQFDITDKLHSGDNVIAVSYDNRYEKSSRWYNGEGINRDVWLHVVEPVHVDRYGTYITTPKIASDRATVKIETNVRNDHKDSVLCKLVTDIVAPDGNVVASRTAVAPFAGGEVFTFRQELVIKNPQLWNVGDARLYRAVSTVFVGEDDTDRYETTFGIRDIEFSPEEGLFVNGKRVYINGVCLHTDLGPLGTASFEAAWNRRLETLTKDLGCNGLRLSHNAYPKYVLDWADRHGVLVVDEFFDKWEESYYGKGAKTGELHLRDVKTQMARDRNHPSVFIWSVGNEVYQQIEKEKTNNGGVEMLKMFIDEAHKFDPSRKASCSQYPNRYGSVTKKTDAKVFYAAEPHQFEFYTDVVCTNYLERFWDADHKKYPQLVFMEGEMSVGELGYDFFNFDHSYPVGQFYWGGTDYIGESFGWPSKGWVRGLVDFTNHLKPVGYSVKSFYTTEPMVKLIVIPNNDKSDLVWNDLKIEWNTMETKWNYGDGQRLKIQVMSNCDETELLLNGESLGRKQLPSKNKVPELTWMVNYKQGELKAIGYKNGVKVAEDVLRTAGKPAKIVVNCDVKTLKANGLDLAYLDYTVVDKEGNVCVDDVKLEFKVSGQGINAGVANDDMLSNEPWQANYRTTSHGRAQLIVRSTDKAGKINVLAKAKGLKSIITEIKVE